MFSIAAAVQSQPVTVSMIGDAVVFNAVIVLGDLHDGMTGSHHVPFWSLSPDMELTEGVDVALVLAFCLALEGCSPYIGPWSRMNQIPKALGLDRFNMSSTYAQQLAPTFLEV